MNEEEFNKRLAKIMSEGVDPLLREEHLWGMRRYWIGFLFASVGMLMLDAIGITGYFVPLFALAGIWMNLD